MKLHQRRAVGSAAFSRRRAHSCLNGKLVKQAMLFREVGAHDLLRVYVPTRTKQGALGVRSAWCCKTCGAYSTTRAVYQSLRCGAVTWKQANGHRIRIGQRREAQRDKGTIIQAYDRAQIEAIFDTTIGFLEGILTKYEEDKKKGRKGTMTQK